MRADIVQDMQTNCEETGKNDQVYHLAASTSALYFGPTRSFFLKCGVIQQDYVVAALLPAGKGSSSRSRRLGGTANETMSLRQNNCQERFPHVRATLAH